jgi:hypothetical protein
MDKFVMGLIAVLALLTIVTTTLLDSYNKRIEILETDNLSLEMRIGTNKLLIKEMIRKFVPDEIALKEKING